MDVSNTAEFDHPKGLLELLEQQAEEERNGVAETGKAEAASIREEARALAKRRREKALHQTEEELAAELQRARERAEAEAYMVEMTAKDRVTDEILAAVRSKLSALAESPEFVHVLEALLEELLPEAPEGGVLLAPQQHVDQVRRWLADRDRSDLAVEPFTGLRDGVAVQDGPRTYRISNTLTSRLNRQTGALRRFCLERLKPESRQA